MPLKLMNAGSQNENYNSLQFLQKENYYITYIIIKILHILENYAEAQYDPLYYLKVTCM